MGNPETGSGQVCQQVSRDIERREQTEAVHSHRPDWWPSCAFSGKTHLHSHVYVELEYDLMLSVFVTIMSLLTHVVGEKRLENRKDGWTE